MKKRNLINLISFKDLEIRKKFFVIFITVTIGLALILTTTLIGLNSYQKTSNKLLKAVEELNRIQSLSNEIEGIHNTISLQIIDGKKRRFKTDLQKTKLYEWLQHNKESLNSTGKNTSHFLKLWKTYLNLAKTVSNNIFKIDNSLSGYLSDTHEDVYKYKTKKISSITKISFYRWVNQQDRLDYINDASKANILKLKKLFNDIAKKEKSGIAVDKETQHLLNLIEDTKDILEDNADSNEKYKLIFKNRMTNIYKEISKMFTQLSLKKLENLKKEKKKQEDMKKNLTILIISVSSGIIFLIFIVIALIVKTTIAPINMMNNKLKELSEKGGDLTISIPSFSEDEIGQMTQNLNKFIKNLRNIVSTVLEKTEELKTISQVISKGTENATYLTAQTSSETENIAESLAEVTNHFKTTEQTMMNLSKMVNNISATSQSSSAILNSALLSMNEIEQSSLEIANITELVDDIAFQTNLLSLNASIEAAHAGEHGKEFAVVALEVRELSNKSAEAAKQISKIVKTTNQRVKDGSSFVKNSNKMFEKIISEFNSLSDETNKLLGELKINMSAIVEINSTLSSIRKAVDRNASFVEEMASQSKEMDGHTKELNNKINKFKI